MLSDVLMVAIKSQKLAFRRAAGDPQSSPPLGVPFRFCARPFWRAQTLTNPPLLWGNPQLVRREPPPQPIPARVCARRSANVLLFPKALFDALPLLVRMQICILDIFQLVRTEFVLLNFE